MKEVLSTALQSLLVAVIPVLGVYLATLIRNVILKSKTVIGDEYSREISEIIYNTVASVNQTYVDTLKKTNSFSLANQAEAASRALSECKLLLSDECLNYIQKVFGDTEKYLISRIEAEVRAQKDGGVIHGIL